MKKILCFILTLLTSVTLVFLPDSFAQVGSPEYVVRVIYFLPSDRTPQPDINAKLDRLIKDTQLFYVQQMMAHGFGSKTFQFEADAAGKLVVHRINGQFTDAYYNSGTWNKVWQEIEGQLDLSNNIYLTALDTSTEVIDNYACGIGGGSSLGGRALMPASGPCFNATLTAHELGHAFGLMHDNRIRGKWMPPADSFDPMVTSFCSAEWLDAHRYFKVNQTLSKDQRIAVEALDPILISSSPSAPPEMTHLCGVGAFDDHKYFKVNQTVPGDAPPAFEMLGPPSLAAAPNAIRIRFSVTDADGLHQVRLHTPEWDPYVAGGFIACKRVSGTSATVEFVTTELSPRSESIQLQMIDVRGNFGWSEPYPITVTTVLPPATAVSIPDTQLAAAIREKIGNITTHSLLNLRTLYDLPPGTTNLTGLEYAHNLKGIGRWGGEIVDLRPLANLTSLWVLQFPYNQVSDITALENLENLRALDLNSNQVSDITALENLTNLRRLLLASNQVSDITALRNLTKLQALVLHSNQVSDITALGNLENLRELNLVLNQISDITALENLINLRHLDLNSNQISDITAFPNLENLRVLYLAGNQISDITTFPNLTKLQALNLNYNQISDVTALGNLENLGYLELSSNQISDITALGNLTNLAWLTLAENDLTDITALRNLTNLGGLSLQFNQISDITTLENLIKLKQLVLISNQISDITALRNLTNLTILNLSGNQITDVSPLVGLINLEILYLAGNPIEDLSPLRILVANNPNLMIDIEIPPPPTGLTFSPSTIADQIFTVGEPVNLTLPTATGGVPPYTYSLSPIPEGLSFSTTERELSGTPTTAETITATYTATDAADVSASLTFTMDVVLDVDVNDDGQTTVIDLAIVALFYGTQVPADIRLPADVNADGMVDILDLTAVAQGIDTTRGNPISVKAVELAVLMAAAQAAELDTAAGAPRRIGSPGTAAFLSVRSATKNVADALATARTDHRLQKGVALLEKLLTLLTEMSTIPETTALLPNYPNPFNPETWIPYELSESADVTLTVYNMRGVVIREIKLGHQPAGVYRHRSRAIRWDGRNYLGEKVASGVYFYTLKAGDYVATRKLLIQK